MFSFLTDSIENALDVVGDVMTGEDVNKRQVAKLIADGVSVVALAGALNMTVDAVRSMVEEE
jgi:hypothetical protein